MHERTYRNVYPLLWEASVEIHRRPSNWDYDRYSNDELVIAIALYVAKTGCMMFEELHKEEEQESRFEIVEMLQRNQN